MDNYNILTSPNVLIDAKSKGFTLSSLSIQLEDEKYPRKINLTNVDIDKMVVDHHLSLFLDRPLG